MGKVDVRGFEEVEVALGNEEGWLSLGCCFHQYLRFILKYVFLKCV